MSEIKFIPPSLIECNGTISNIEMCARDANANNEYMILAMLDVMRRQAEMNAEMYAMLELIKACEITNGDINGWSSEIKVLLAKARGES